MGVAGWADGILGQTLGAIGNFGPLSVNALVLVGAAAVALFAASATLLRRRVATRARAARLRWRVHDLKEELRQRLAEPNDPFAGPATPAPTLGASAAFEADIEAAARTVLREAGGRRAKAKYLLRKRLSGNGLNGSEAAYWRQLGALSLLDDTRDALAAYTRAAELAPDDPQAQMLLGVLYLRSGRLEAAEEAFRRQMKLAGDLGGGVARYRAGTMLGDVLAAKGDTDQALAAYEEAQRDAKLLAEGEPDDAGRQRDLSLTCDRIGDVLLARDRLDAALASYKHSLSIASALVKRDPANAGWQRDLSVTHERIGEVLERQGDLDGALASYRQGLAIAEALARRNRSRPEWQWDVSASWDRIGDVLLAKGKVAEALAAYRRGLAIAESLLAVEPARTVWQRDLAATYHKVGSLEAVSGNEGEALELLERGRAIIAGLDRIAAHRAQWRSDLQKFDQALETLRP
jgi:tetratricopeptide (TPR) repeat protein